FIKEYAAAVDLDPNEILAGYQDGVPEPEVENDIPYTRMQRTRQESRASKSPAIFSIMPTIIVILLIIGIILAGVYFYQKAVSSGNPEDVEQRDTDEVIRPDHLDSENGGNNTPPGSAQGDDNENNEDNDPIEEPD